MIEPCNHAEAGNIIVSEQERQDRRLSETHLRQAALLLHTRGYIVLKQGLPLSLAEDCKSAFDVVLKDCFESCEGDAWYQVAQKTQAVFWRRNFRWRIFPKLRMPFGDAWVLANPLIRPLLQNSLGDGHYCKFVSSDTCLKGAVIQSPHRELNPGRTWEPTGLVVNVPLGQCGLRNGPLEVWYGGSHLWNQEVLETLDYDDDVQDDRNAEAEEFARLFPSRRLQLELGDVVIRDPAMMHRGTVNHTKVPRSMLTICYFRKDQEYDYGKATYNLDEEIWQSLDPEVQALFEREFKNSSIPIE